MASHSKNMTRLINLKSAFVECKTSDFINLDAVEETHNKTTFRCLLGVYRYRFEEVSMTQAAQHFGISASESGFLFGPSSVSTLTERGMMIDALIGEPVIADEISEMEHAA